MPSAAQHIVIATFGSLGDLHPFLALATELQQRGHRVTVATALHYADTIRALGFHFEQLGPDISPEDPAILHRLMHSARGPEYLFRKLFLPHLPQLFAELERVTQGADLMIASEVILGAAILAEKTGIPWVSVLLSPISFLSPHDPSILPPLGWMTALHGMPLAFHKAVLKLPGLALRRWSAPLQALRKDLGLPPMQDALLRGKLSAPLVLAMFSKHFAKPQPDWPQQTVQPGFPYYTQTTRDPDIDRRIEVFIAAGEQPPIVFTLGSAAVHVAGDFFEVSAATALRLKRRAILLAGNADLRYLEHRDLIAVPYADHSKLFPRAAGIVHQGGIGTTAEALRSGVPSLVVPFNFDQPDNAARTVRLGVGLTLPRRKYNRRHAYYAMHRLLRDEAMHRRSQALAQQIQSENGTRDAADAIDDLLRKTRSPRP